MEKPNYFFALNYFYRHEGSYPDTEHMTYLFTNFGTVEITVQKFITKVAEEARQEYLKHREIVYAAPWTINIREEETTLFYSQNFDGYAHSDNEGCYNSDLGRNSDQVYYCSCMDASGNYHPDVAKVFADSILKKVARWNEIAAIFDDDLMEAGLEQELGMNIYL